MAEHLGAIQVGYGTTKINVMGGSKVSKGPISEFKIDLNYEMANNQDSQNISDFMINRIHFTQNFDFPSSKTDL